MKLKLLFTVSVVVLVLAFFVSNMGFNLISVACAQDGYDAYNYDFLRSNPAGPMGWYNNGPYGHSSNAYTSWSHPWTPAGSYGDGARLGGYSWEYNSGIYNGLNMGSLFGRPYRTPWFRLN